MTTLLIVEDEALIANSMKNRLENLGYRVAGIAVSGESAIQKAKLFQPDLVLMDIKLQGRMDGVTAAETIRTRFNIPIIYLTAFPDNETLGRAKLTEPFGYICKPFEESTLHASIQMALYKHRMEKKLKESETRYRSLIENSNEGILLLNEDGHVAEWNAGEERITGLRYEEVIGKPFWEIQYRLIPKSEKRNRNALASLRKSILETIRIGETEFHGREMENEIERPDGSRRFIQSSMFLVRTESSCMIGSISRDITGHRLAQEELKKSREEMRQLAAHLQSVREEERTLVAREIHDELGQTLTAVKMDLSLLSRKIAPNETLMQGKIRGAIALVDEAARTVKKISSQLRPGLLDDLGLAAAMEWQTEEFQKRTGIRFTVRTPHEELNLPGEVSTAVFRIFQEALTNVARHSGASHVRISLILKESLLEMQVADNGKGIELNRICDPKSFGLIGMKERVRFLQGDIQIKGTPKRGTRVSVKIPIFKKPVLKERKQA